MLKIENLHVSVDSKEIIKGLDLEVKKGEIHAIMGLNGSGKSTLAYTLAGREGYEATSGIVTFLGEDLLELSPEDRACKGVFLAFQYPVELPGVITSHFLRTTYNAIQKHRNQPEMGVKDFAQLLKEKLALLGLDPEFLKRSVNTGFSGGEKKKSEILQLAVLAPKLAILDETDSGLDIDALKAVSEGVLKVKASCPEQSLIVVTHYQRLLDLIRPDFVHIMIGGKIVKSGDANLALEVDRNGYKDLQTGTAAFA